MTKDDIQRVLDAYPDVNLHGLPDQIPGWDEVIDEKKEKLLDFFRYKLTEQEELCTKICTWLQTVPQQKDISVIRHEERYICQYILSPLFGQEVYIGAFIVAAIHALFKVSIIIPKERYHNYALGINISHQWLVNEKKRIKAEKGKLIGTSKSELT